MYRKLIISVISATMLAFTGIASATVNNKVIVGYLPTVNNKQITKTELSAKLDKLNILVYGFLQTQPITIKNGVINSNIGAIDINKAQTGLAAFAKLNNTSKNLKKIFTVGDNTFTSIFYDPSGNSIKNFTDSAKAIIDQYNLDGISINYVPSTQDFTAAEAAKYTKLIQALRAKLEPNKIIIVTVSADPRWINKIAPADWNIIKNSVNYIIIKSYDFHGAFDYPSQTGFLTSLYDDPSSTYGNNELSIDKAVKTLENIGIPSDKIIIGVPAFGSAVKNVADVNDGLYQNFGLPIPKGNLDKTDCNPNQPLAPNACTGAYTYAYIVNDMRTKGFQEHERLSGTTVSAVWAYHPNNTFISYANVNLVKAEAEYTNENNLGGMMLWPITGDTPASSSSSLLSAIYSGLN